MNKKFFYLYLIGGLIAIGLFAFDAINTTIPKMSASNLVLDIAPIVLFLYLCYKTYHEKKDQELM